MKLDIYLFTSRSVSQGMLIKSLIELSFSRIFTEYGQPSYDKKYNLKQIPDL